MRKLGIVALVMAMVLSLAGLASAEEATTESTEDMGPAVMEPGSESFTFADPIDLEMELFQMTVYWGGFEDPCSAPTEPAPDGLTETSEETTLPTACLDVSGPNGQVNHGTFVSAFVHWLKSDAAAEYLGEYDGPRGKFVKQAAKNDFGKGMGKDKVKSPDGDDDDEGIETDGDDGNGPPPWAHGNKDKKDK